MLRDDLGLTTRKHRLYLAMVQPGSAKTYIKQKEDTGGDFKRGRETGFFYKGLVRWGRTLGGRAAGKNHASASKRKENMRSANKKLH